MERGELATGARAPWGLLPDTCFHQDLRSEPGSRWCVDEGGIEGQGRAARMSRRPREAGVAWVLKSRRGWAGEGQLHKVQWFGL